VHDVRRRRHEAPRRHPHRLAVRPEHEPQLAVEHVEGVGVLVVDVWLGPAFAGCQAVPRDRDLLSRGEHDGLAVREIGDRFAVGAADEDAAGIVGLLSHDPIVPVLLCLRLPAALPTGR
jgi:hypothetical protein